MEMVTAQNDNTPTNVTPEEEALDRDTLEMVFRVALAREAAKRYTGTMIKRLFVSRETLRLLRNCIFRSLATKWSAMLQCDWFMHIQKPFSIAPDL